MKTYMSEPTQLKTKIHPQQKMKTKNMTTPHLRKSIGRRGFLLIALALAWLALSPQARAVCQQGCLTNQNTVLGDDALLNNTGTDNTANGFDALLSNSTASFNTANGSQALFSNTTGHDNTANGRQALYSNTDGFFNTATASDALFSNTI